MSLKAFHLFFIAVSVVVCLGFGAWGIHDHVTHTNPGSLVLGLLSLGLAVALVVYGRRVRRKFRHLGTP